MNTRTPTLALLAGLAVLGIAASTATAASIQLSSDAPHASEYTMTVKVSSDFHLVPLMAQPQNHAGEGHIHYLVKAAGETQFKDACSAGKATCAAATDYATPKTTFTFKDLKAGDVVAARLVNNDHSNLSPDVLQQQTVLAASKGSPAAGPLLVIGLLAFAALLARRQA